MNLLLVIGVGFVLLLIASRTYPFWIARVFRQDDSNPPPSERFADGREFVKTASPIVFAHHFASIAGAGPIVGPIIALAFGWGPAWVWIVLGGIFYGAVHDMSAMFVSVRESGRTIAEIARRTLGNFGYFLFVAFLLIVISFVNAIFLQLSASALTSSYPLEFLGPEAERFLRVFTDPVTGVEKGRIGGIATTSVIIMTLAAPILGWLIHRRQLPGVAAFGLAGFVCVGSVLAGFAMPVTLTPDTWMIVLAAYVFFACWIPVWVVLQPRDFMNVQLLYGGILLLLGGAVVAGFSGGETAQMQLPIESIKLGEKHLQGPMWPIMFITIACGAISGFHSLVATGTTVRQIPRESDCRRIGYNAMILESFLALLVVAAVASQLSGEQYFHAMAPPGGGGGPILTFSVACGHLFAHLGIPIAIGCVLGILIIEGFLVTTLDTAIRLARYLFEELWSCLFKGQTPRVLKHPVTNTLCAVAMMLLFAYSKDASDALWPYFGSGNQLIGALTLTTVAIWLMQRGRSYWFALIPAVFMVATAVSALAFIVHREWDKTEEGAARFIVGGAGALLLALAVGFVVIAAIKIRAAART